jgi:hypothetical protein
MQRFAPTRSLATGVVAAMLAFLMALVATMPLTHIRAMNVLYVAMIVTGTSMLLRERIFVPVYHHQVAERAAEPTLELVG